MKISRDELKGLVKECLIELLAEGLSSPGQPLEEQFDRGDRPAPKRRPQSPGPRRPKFDPTLDRPVIPEAIARNAAGRDNVLADVLADTARTTYTKMGHTLLTAEGAAEEASGVAQIPVHGLDAASMMVAEHEPEELFGESADKWAALAFAGTPGPTSRS